jgi:hypothetical protein
VKFLFLESICSIPYTAYTFLIAAILEDLAAAGFNLPYLVADDSTTPQKFNETLKSIETSEETVSLDQFLCKL